MSQQLSLKLPVELTSRSRGFEDGEEVKRKKYAETVRKGGSKMWRLAGSVGRHSTLGYEFEPCIG